MTVELRINNNEAECDWGVFTNGGGDPLLGFQHLILVTAAFIEQILGGPKYDRFGTLCSITRQHSPDRLFFTAEREGRRWVWELFDAHWADGEGPNDLFVGRWMD